MFVFQLIEGKWYDTLHTISSKKIHQKPTTKKKNKNHTQTHTSGQNDSPNDKALYKQIENETLSHWLTNHKECGNVH